MNRNRKMLEKNKIIELLADRLKIDVKTAEIEYQSIIDELHEDLKTNGIATLTGLGDFVIFDGKISFVPDAFLSKSINFRYHGLDEWEVATLKVPSIQEDETDPGSEPAVFIVDEEEFVPEIETSTETSEVENVEQEVPEVTNIKTKPVKIRVTKKYMNRGLGLKRAFIGFLILFTLLAGSSIAWYNDWLAGYGVPSIYDVFPELATKGDPQSITLSSPSIQVPVPAPPSTEATPDSSFTSSTSLDSQDPELPDPVSPVSPTGLDGAFEDFRRSYFTIISGTFFSEEGATKALTLVQQAGIRSRMRPIKISGEGAWEIHIGQFATREEAVEANKTLPKTFQSNIVRAYGQQ